MDIYGYPENWISICKRMKLDFDIMLLQLLSHFSRVRLCAAPWTIATRFLCPWDSLGKNTGVVAMPSSRGSSQSRDQTRVSCTAGRFFTAEPPGKPFTLYYIQKLTQVKDLNIRITTIKLLEENTVEKLHDIVFGNDIFLAMTPVVWATKKNW